MKSKYQYCIIHEQWTHPDFVEANEMMGKECLFTTSAPPELPVNWELTVSEPSPEELRRMDLNAEELLMDVIGAGL